MPSSRARCSARLAAGDAYNSLAHVSVALGRHERANALYRRAVELGPNVSRHWFNLASSERSLGRLAEAEAACDRAIALDCARVSRVPAAFGAAGADRRCQSRRAVAARARPRRSRDDRRGCSSAMRSARSSMTSGGTRRPLTGSAWRRALAGAISPTMWPPTSASSSASSRRFIRAGADRRRAAVRSTPSRFVFIVGLPRSGTTLVDRILTGLAGVRSNGETGQFRAGPGRRPHPRMHGDSTGMRSQRATRGSPAAGGTAAGRSSRSCR